MVSWGCEYENRFFSLFESGALFPCAICRGTAFPGVDAESVERENISVFAPHPVTEGTVTVSAL